MVVVFAPSGAESATCTVAKSGHPGINTEMSRNGRE
jgi:hypothetical protein